MIALLFIIYLVFIGHGLSNSLIGAAWPSIFMDLAVPDSYLGIISMIKTICMISVNVFGGKLVGRYKTSVILIPSILAIAAAQIIGVIPAQSDHTRTVSVRLA